MAGLGNHQLQIRVHDVPSEMLAEAGVVQASYHRPAQRGAAQRKDVVRRVVEQETDVRRPPRVQPGAEQLAKRSASATSS